MAKRAKEALELYLITPRTNPEDDECWASAIVAAANVTEAKEIHPSGDVDAEWDELDETWGDPDDDDTWVPPYEVVAEKIGVADPHVDPGVLLARWSED